MWSSDPLQEGKKYIIVSSREIQENDARNWVVGRTLEEATERAKLFANGAKFSLEQDEDVLDTWFSSGLWPFSIMGWPDQVPTAAHIYT